MATKSKNNKSRRIDVRVPLELFNEIDQYKKPDQSYSNFVLAAIKHEIERQKKNPS